MHLLTLGPKKIVFFAPHVNVNGDTIPAVKALQTPQAINTALINW